MAGDPDIGSVDMAPRSRGRAPELLRVVSPVRGRGECRALLTALMKEYQGLADERNRLLHNPIGMNEELYIMLRDNSPDPGAIP